MSECGACDKPQLRAACVIQHLTTISPTQCRYMCVVVAIILYSWLVNWLAAVVVAIKIVTACGRIFYCSLTILWPHSHIHTQTHTRTTITCDRKWGVIKESTSTAGSVSELVCYAPDRDGRSVLEWQTIYYANCLLTLWLLRVVVLTQISFGHTNAHTLTYARIHVLKNVAHLI